MAQNGPNSLPAEPTWAETCGNQRGMEECSVFGLVNWLYFTFHPLKKQNKTLLSMHNTDLVMEKGE